MKKIDSLYLHFPFCKHLCNYCDFYKKVPNNRTEELSDFHRYFEESFLEHEKLMEKNGYSWVPLKTLYIGGGTPSLWGSEGSEFLKEFLKKYHIELAPNCEFTLEVNPGSWTGEILEGWESIGVNRYSLGIQSLDGQVIKTLDRVHTVDDVYETLEYFNKRKVNFSVDFMLGLPFSDTFNRDVINELERVLKYQPFHFSVYILTVKNNYTHFKKLPTEEWIEKEYLDVAGFLNERGYKQYEVSNFSLVGFESKHNLNYWKSNTVAALGPSATGFLHEERIRYKWKTKEAVMEIEILENHEYMLEKLYMALRSEGLDLEEKIKKNELWKEVAEKWVLNGYAIIDNKNFLKLTGPGYLLLDSLMNDLFVLKLDQY
ncbi:MAG: coproporphyrinogen III oxidase family protein [Bdellovibrionales bacterium]|nr:coproporphyrinogen III oxidase family protein [Bdellovibrionales bacterium]